jgi:ketosteroid isomerase-like protein
MSSKIQFIKDMEAAAFSGNWEKFKTFFTNDMYYFVGNKTELHSLQEIVDYLIQFRGKELEIYNLEFLLAYEEENTVVTELSVKAVRLADKKHIVFPTVDIYRFKDGRIHDWRVYAIEPTHVGDKSVLTGLPKSA